MTHTIDTATPDDLAAIAALLPRLAEFEVPEHRAPEDLWHGDRALVQAWGAGERPDADVRVVRENNTILGVSVVTRGKDLLTHVPNAHLEILAVAPQAEGQGVGSALLNAAQAEARRQGLATMSLHVFSNNQRARRLYEKMGFHGELMRYVHLLDPS